MKPYKKLLSLAMVFALLISAGIVFTGCGETATEMFNKAQTNLSKAKDIKFKDGTITGKLDVKGQKTEMSAKIDFQAVKSTTDDPRDLQMALSGSFNVFGQNNKFSMFLKDQTVYFDDGMSKEKQKLDMTKDDFKKIMDSAQGTKIDEFVKKEEKDGDKIKLTIDAKEYMKKAIKDVDTSKNSKAVSIKELEKNLDSLGLKEMDVEATIKDGNFKSIKYTIPMNLDGSMLTPGATGNMKLDLTVEFKEISIDTGEKISFPNLKNFSAPM